MCSIFGLGAGASLAIVAAGCMALGLSIPAIWKAGLAKVKSYFHKTPPAA